MIRVTAQVLKVDEKSPITNIVYSKEALEKAIENYNKGDLKFGQFAEENTEFRPSEVACKVENLKIDGDKVIGDIIIVDSPKGVICQKLIKKGEKLAAAPRVEVDEENNLVGIVGIDIIKDERKVFEYNTLKPEE